MSIDRPDISQWLVGQDVIERGRRLQMLANTKSDKSLPITINGSKQWLYTSFEMSLQSFQRLISNNLLASA